MHDLPFTENDLVAWAAATSLATAGPWYVQPNDLIGGTCVMTEDLPPSASARLEVADFIASADAEFVAVARDAMPRLLEGMRKLILEGRVQP